MSQISVLQSVPSIDKPADFTVSAMTYSIRTTLQIMYIQFQQLLFLVFMWLNVNEQILYLSDVLSDTQLICVR